jgi:hypothetical protein
MKINKELAEVINNELKEADWVLEKKEGVYTFRFGKNKILIEHSPSELARQIIVYFRNINK